MRALLTITALVSFACNGQPAPRESAPEPAPWTASAQQVGPIGVGMTTAEAEAALGTPFDASPDRGECVYRRSTRAPEGVLFMEIDRRIARVDVTAPGVPTEQGIEVGASGRYLTVSSNPDHRIVFETDGDHVTRYRVGRLPEVEWVEGCS
jgi:hypothetical protein